jgi:hypothetical protein
MQLRRIEQGLLALMLRYDSADRQNRLRPSSAVALERTATLMLVRALRQSSR